jgi:aquaporin related protein
MLTGNMRIIRGVFIFATQIVGGIAAAGIASSLTPGGLYTKTKLGGGTSKSRGTFIEVFLTALLVFTVLMLAAERNRSTYLAPVGIGLAEFIAMMAGKHPPLPNL